jgi:hypothetical protein
MGRTYNGLRRLWRPGGETLEVIAEVFSQRWRAAARLTPTRLFWQAPTRWLKVEPLSLTGEVQPHHFTNGGKLIR